MELKQIAIEKDNNDDLKSFKSRFVNNENEIYLDGNSLGKLPKSVLSKLEDTLQNQWGKQPQQHGQFGQLRKLRKRKLTQSLQNPL